MGTLLGMTIFPVNWLLPEVMCTASIISQHMTRWSEAHYKAACKMAAYGAHHEDGLVFTASKQGLQLVSYADSDFTYGSQREGSWQIHYQNWSRGLCS